MAGVRSNFDRDPYAKRPVNPEGTRDEYHVPVLPTDQMYLENAPEGAFFARFDQDDPTTDHEIKRGDVVIMNEEGQIVHAYGSGSEDESGSSEPVGEPEAESSDPTPDSSDEEADRTADPVNEGQ